MTRLHLERLGCTTTKRFWSCRWAPDVKKPFITHSVLGINAQMSPWIVSEHETHELAERYLNMLEHEYSMALAKASGLLPSGIASTVAFAMDPEHPIHGHRRSSTRRDRNYYLSLIFNFTSSDAFVWLPEEDALRDIAMEKGWLTP